jgi:hypothetical protein
MVSLKLTNYDHILQGRVLLWNCCCRGRISSMLKFNSESILYSLSFQFHFSCSNPIMVFFANLLTIHIKWAIKLLKDLKLKYYFTKKRAIIPFTKIRIVPNGSLLYMVQEAHQYGSNKSGNAIMCCCWICAANSKSLKTAFKQNIPFRLLPMIFWGIRFSQKLSHFVGFRWVRFLLGN